LDQT